jgi:hypothetical protein
MNGITKRCVSFAQGSRDPLQRVNYAFGLVLGVDEFVDEQRYFLEKEYQHNRALHGAGTVNGLQVTAGENGEDIEIRVAPGIGIDQYGRVFVVRETQCASLGAWVDDHNVAAGNQAIYVIARYAECETELVPIAGQPCSSSEQLSAPSRLRDHFEIDFALLPPPHESHVAVINLSEFLHRFRRERGAESRAGLGNTERLAAIIGPDFITLEPEEFRTHINTTIEALTGSAGARLITIRPQEVDALLDDIFSYWVAEVRPALRPDLISPSTPISSEADPPVPDILLARIDLVVPDEGAPLLENAEVDNSIRPYLLHTQLIQELFDIPDLAGEGSEAAPDKPVRAFATLEDVGPRALLLWLHIARDLGLVPGENVFLFRIGANGAQNPLQFNLAEDTSRSNDVGRYFSLNTAATLTNGDHLLLLFDAAGIQLSGGESLADFIESAPFAYTGFDPSRGRLSVFHIVERAGEIDRGLIREIVSELLPLPIPTTPFVTITPLTRSDGEFDFLHNYELWFHLDGFVEQNEGSIENLNSENLFLFAEFAPGDVQRVGIEPSQVRPNVWLANPGRLPRQGLAYARFVFRLDDPMEITAFDPQGGGLNRFATLREYMENTRQRLEGHMMQFEEFGEEVLVVYVREQGRAQEVGNNG